MNKSIIALSAVLALAACGEEEDKTTPVTQNQTQTETIAPAEAELQSWNEDYVVELQDIEVILPDNRLFHLDATAFVPSVITEGMSMHEYAGAARAVIQDKAQYYVDIYACRGHGDTFYAAMPTSTLQAQTPFTHHQDPKDINPNVLFNVENMQTRYENFGNDEFTVAAADHVGEREYSHEDAMEAYIAEDRGSHKPQDPTCSANFTKNIGDPAP